MSKEIDDIFSDKIGEEIEKEIKVKRKKVNSKVITKSIILTLITVVILNIILGFISKKFIDSRFHIIMSRKSMEYMVTKPNEYIGQQSYIETGLFKYNSTYEIGKKIGSKTLYAGSEQEAVGIFNFGQVGYVGEFMSIAIPTLDNEIENRRSDVNGLRRLYFMMPFVEYKNIINDFHYLDELKENQYVEMVLSFDKEYSYEEVNKMFSSNLITFYWINNDTEDTKEYYKESKYYFSEDTVLGIKSTNYDGNFITDTNERLDIFKGAVSTLGGWYKDNIDLDNLKISGIVVVGKPNEIKELASIKSIKHAVIGNVIDKY